MTRIRRALVSISDKTGIEEFVKGLNDFGVEILSTGGTAKRLSQIGIPVRSVSDYTGYPEMMDGRVKTLHPKIHAALLALRDNEKHMEEVKKHKIELIDMVVVNLYPFEKTVANPGVKLEEAIENIDIGGPTMLRSAAKNYRSVAIICSPARYQGVLKEMKENDGCVSQKTCAILATEVFKHTSSYDSMIYGYLSKQFEKHEGLPDTVDLRLRKLLDLRYGENSHQKAAFYTANGSGLKGIAGMKKLHGKELSFNNLLDIDAAWKVTLDFDEPVAVIIKHTNPCGVAVRDDVYAAYAAALACDPVSAFGGIIGFNREVDEKTANEIGKNFYEAVVAPNFSKEALEVLKKKENIRLIEMGREYDKKEYDYKRVSGGILVQDSDNDLLAGEVEVVTSRKPTKEELGMLEFAWKVCKHVKSNAIVYAKNKQAIGIGAGQMSRVDSSELAISKAKKHRLDVRGSVMASDAFFPFRDAVEAAAAAGVTAIIQPGGAKRDEDVIKACDENNIAMVVTGMRHFKH